MGEKKLVGLTGGRPTKRPNQEADEWVKDKPGKEEKTRLTVDLDIDLHSEVKARCAKNRETMAKYVRRLIEEDLLR